VFWFGPLFHSATALEYIFLIKQKKTRLKDEGSTAARHICCQLSFTWFYGKARKVPQTSRDSQTAVAKWKAFSATLGKHIENVKSITSENIN